MMMSIVYSLPRSIHNNAVSVGLARCSLMTAAVEEAEFPTLPLTATVQLFQITIVQILPYKRSTHFEPALTTLRQ